MVEKVIDARIGEYCASCHTCQVRCPRGAPDHDPLWNLLDTTPEGRGRNWYLKLSYD